MSQVKDIFFELVKIDSPTGYEDVVAKFVYDFLCDLGYKPKIINKNVFCAVSGNGEPIFLNAHLDTVEPGRNIKPSLKDGKIVSDGKTILGADNKVAVAALLSAFKKAKDEKRDVRSIELLFTASEEVGNYGAIEFDKSKLKSTVGFIFDKEGELGEIIKCSPYYARFDVMLIGEAAHAARREKAKPVIDVFIPLLQSIESLRTKNLLVNVGKINGGSARNTVMGNIEFIGEIRSFDKQIFYKAIDDFKSMIENQQTDLKIQFDVTIENPGYIHNESKLKSVKAFLKKVTNIDFLEVDSYGCSDANIFNDNQNGFTVYNLSDGSFKHHSVEEYVSLDNLNMLSEIIYAIVTSKESLT